MQACSPNWRRFRCWPVVLALGFRLGAGSSAFAQGQSHPQDQRIFQMVHTAWTARDGAPQSINCLAQTTDGTLWLGARDGLYSFDGITFSAFQPVSGSVPRKNVQFLYAANDGSLWAFGGTTQPTRIRDGKAKIVDRTDRGTVKSVYSIEQSSDGTIWGIVNSRELVRLGADDIWHVVDAPKPDRVRLGPFLIDSLDTQWLLADDLLYRRSRGEESFTSTGIYVYDAMQLEEGLDHSIWLVGSTPSGVTLIQPAGQPPEVGLKHVDQSGKRLSNPFTHEDVNDVVAAADGSVWVSHISGALQRLRAREISGKHPIGDSDSPDLFGVSDGLTTTGYRELLRDRDGDIWVAGGRGLDRFQRAIMVPVVEDAIGGWWSVCASTDSDVSLAVMDGYRAVVRGNRLTRLKNRTNITSILCGQVGRDLLLEGGGIAEIRHGRIERLPLLPVPGPYWDRYRFSSVAVLANHRLIASTIGSGNHLWILNDHRWELFLPTAGITDIWAIVLGRDHDLYLGSGMARSLCSRCQTLRYGPRHDFQSGG